MSAQHSHTGARANFWKAKVAAWIHDPGEKAIILMRTELGHERSPVIRQMCERLFSSRQGLPSPLREAVLVADHWASAADRPALPIPDGTPSFWSRVQFAERPKLVHPLAGKPYDISPFADDPVAAPERVSELAARRYLDLVRDDGGTVDWRATFLRLWRGTPEPLPEWGALWRLLPADSRFPDHSIWDHLRVCSALAGAQVAGSVAVLSVSIGPVQTFIAQARSTSDLWAGSHLLSSIACEAMCTVAERYGPDSVLFPSLFNVAAVDRWYSNQGIFDATTLGDERCRELRRPTDSSPLFVAALPNRFLCLIPAGEVEETAAAVTTRVRDWVVRRAREAWESICEAAKVQSSSECVGQIDAQVSGFPEVRWAAVEWPSSGSAGELAESAGVRKLRQILDRLTGGVNGEGSFFGSSGWRLLSRESFVGGARFFAPSPGVLYPAVHDSVERAHAAVKGLTPFDQLVQVGDRCSLCGERECLGSVRNDQPERSAVRETWDTVARERPAWARAGERLCAVCTLKRMWPELFVRELGDEAGERPQRYVVSTHAMALSPSLERLLDDAIDERKIDALIDACGEGLKDVAGVALPRRLAIRLSEAPSRRRSLVRQLPAFLDVLRESDEPSDARLLQRVEKAFADAIGARPETYYAMLRMDGDRMGAWLSGGETEAGRPTYGDLWHPDVYAAVTREFANDPTLREYLGSQAPPSPSYHAALSSALNDLSTYLVPLVVEQLYRGKVIYAGGDDVLAMVPVADLLEVMLTLRAVYGGIVPPDATDYFPLRDGRGTTVHVRDDHVLVERSGRRTLYRTLGRRATASMGAVVAHCTMPLGSVVREAQLAESRAKEGGRNAFSLTLAKRSGGSTVLTLPFDFGQASHVDQPSETPLGVLLRLTRLLREDVSRRAAYTIQAWLLGLPAGPAAHLSPRDYESLLRENLAYQLQRQAAPGRGAAIEAIAEELARVTCRLAARGKGSAPELLAALLGHAEFLAREQRGLRPRD